MLVPLKEMLDDAARGGYAVVAPGFASLLIAQGLIDLAEEQRAPLILAHPALLGDARDLKSLQRFTEVVRGLAATSPARIGLHLDGARSLPEAQEAIDTGYTSLTVDARQEPWAASVERVRRIVEVAHAAGAHVEVRTGSEVGQAVALASQSGADALAVSIAATGGQWAGWLKTLREQVAVPLALADAPGMPAGDLRRAVGLGVRKIDLSADLFAAIREEVQAAALSPTFGPGELAGAQQRAARRVVEHALSVSGSAGTADPLIIDIPVHAERLYRSGYSCTEAVFNAFAAAEGYPSDTMQRAASIFLGGMCNQGLTCGTLIGGLMVIGARQAHINPANKRPRRGARALGVELIRWYDEQKGSTVCRALLDLDLSNPEQANRYMPSGYFDRVCVPLVYETCQWLVDRFAEEDARS